MSKLYCIVIVSLFLCASCDQSTPDPQVVTQQLESKLAMQEKINKIAAQLRMDCDSMLMQMALSRADSLLRSKKVLLKKK